MGSLIFIIIIWFIIIKGVQSRKKLNDTRRTGEKSSAASGYSAPGRTSAVTRPKPTAKKPKATAVPNQPKQVQRTWKEEKTEESMQESRKACTYQAAYSKGRPDRIGRRGDYEPGIPSGMVRIKCAYCGAENFVPEGTREHYHCYFCWEKL